MTGIVLGAAFLAGAAAGWPAAIAMTLCVVSAVMGTGNARLLLPALAVIAAGIGGA